MILDWRITYGERHLDGNGGWLYVAEKMDEMKLSVYLYDDYQAELKKCYRRRQRRQKRCH